MKTKYLTKFLNNVAHLDVDLEFVDILQEYARKNELKRSEGKYVFDHVKKVKHVKLSARMNSDHSRILVVNHLKSSVREAFMKSLYESAHVYFQEILQAAVKKGIDLDRILGEHNKTYSCKDIIKLGSYQKIQEAIAADIFRGLENLRSTKDLIIKMIKKLDLIVSDGLIDEAMPYFDIRHKLVHCEGKADKEFCTRYPLFGAEEDKIIRISYEILSKAKISITNLITDFDKQIVDKEIVLDSDFRH